MAGSGAGMPGETTPPWLPLLPFEIGAPGATEVEGSLPPVLSRFSPVSGALGATLGDGDCGTDVGSPEDVCWLFGVLVGSGAAAGWSPHATPAINTAAAPTRTAIPFQGFILDLLNNDNFQWLSKAKLRPFYRLVTSRTLRVRELFHRIGQVSILGEHCNSIGPKFLDTQRGRPVSPDALALST